ncbi:RHS repeat-associated core domain-containing protein [Snodgrassella alvi]|uniref:RHS repeat-associated core domain-containing protein n=1 Tax=Snodgrassella alvi TaxID=1196083 RepID=UPI00352F883B
MNQRKRRALPIHLRRRRPPNRTDRTDVNDAPEELTDEDGHIVWACSYQLWGKPIQEIEHSQIQQNLRYQGQYLDRETGLHYNTFRYYDSDIGRFTQPDPIGLLGGFNLYQYAPNGLMWVDPLGFANRPNNGKYNIFFDHAVDQANRYSSDAVQFNRANKEFIKKMDKDIAFRKNMLKRYPELSTWLKNGNKNGSPSGLTWHHHEDTNKLVLVDRKDHNKNHALYHPKGKGGRDLWGGGTDGRRGRLNGLTGKKLC